MKLKFALHFSISMKIASTIKKFNFSDIRIVHLLSSVCGKNIFPFFLVNLVLTLDVWQYCGNKKFSFAHRANCPQTFLPFEVLHQDLFRTFEGHLPSRFNSNLGMPSIEILEEKIYFGQNYTFVHQRFLQMSSFRMLQCYQLYQLHGMIMIHKTYA